MSQPERVGSAAGARRSSNEGLAAAPVHRPRGRGMSVISHSQASLVSSRGSGNFPTNIPLLRSKQTPAAEHQSTAASLTSLASSLDLLAPLPPSSQSSLPVPGSVNRGRSKSVFVSAANSMIGGNNASNVGNIPSPSSSAAALALASLHRNNSSNRSSTPESGRNARSNSVIASGLSVNMSSSDVKKIKKQTYELAKTGVSGVVSAQKLWRKGMMKLWSLRNAFEMAAKEQEDPIGGVGTSGGAGGSNDDGMSRRMDDDGQPLQSWEAMMSELAQLNHLHRTRFEGRSATVTLKESSEEENRWFYAGEVESGGYSYLHLPLIKSKKLNITQIRFQIQALNAAPDDLELYVCVANKQPNRDKHTWRLSRHQKLLIISKNDNKFTYSNGHLYLSVYGIGKNVNMMNYALRIQASSDTFVPYSQVLSQATGDTGNELARDTTAKNRLNNKLHALKHNRLAFESFQRKVQDIIESRIKASREAVDAQITSNSAGPSPKAAKNRKVINFVASNKMHTHIHLHSPRELKKMLYVSTLQKKDQELNQSASMKSLAPPEGNTSSSHQHHSSSSTTKSTTLHPSASDGALYVNSAGLRINVEEEGDHHHHGEDDEAALIQSSDDDAQQHEWTAEESAEAATLAQQLEIMIAEATAIVQQRKAAAAAAAAASSSLSSESPSPTSPLTQPRKSKELKVAIFPSAGSPTGSPTHASPRGSLLSTQSPVTGPVLPLTPVNLVLHNLMTGSQDDMLVSNPSPKASLTALQQAAAEKRRLLSGENRERAESISKPAVEIIPVEMTPTNNDSSGASPVEQFTHQGICTDPPITSAESALQSPELDEGEPKAATEAQARTASAAGSDERPGSSASSTEARSDHDSEASGDSFAADSADEQALDTEGHEGPPIVSTVDVDASPSSATGVSTPFDSPTPSAGLSTPTSPMLRPNLSRMVSAISGSESNSTVNSPSAVHHHSRSASVYTDISAVHSHGSADTHAALQSSLARHLAEGGQLNATGSARKWIRIPFTTPKTNKRRRLQTKAATPTQSGSTSIAATPAATASHFTFAERGSTASSQTARDSRQPSRGSLQSSRRQSITNLPSGPDALAAKSALLRQTVENNLKLTQVALNKKRAALNDQAQEGAGGGKKSFNPVIGAIIETHGPMLANEYETTLNSHRQGLRRNNPAKWMGRSFAVRSTANSGLGDPLSSPRASEGDSAYFSQTSKTHRIKFELAYLHRATKSKKKSNKSAAVSGANPITVAIPESDAAEGEIEETQPFPSPLSAAATTTEVVAETSEQASSPVVAGPAPSADAASKASASQPNSPNMAVLRASRNTHSHHRTMSLPLQMASTDVSVLSSFDFTPASSPVIATAPGLALSAISDYSDSSSSSQQPPVHANLNSLSIGLSENLNAHLVQLATGLTPVLEGADDTATPGQNRSTSALSHTSHDSHMTPMSPNNVHQLSSVAEGNHYPSFPHTSLHHRHQSMNTRPGSAPKSHAIAPVSPHLPRASSVLVQDNSHTSLKALGGAGKVNVIVAPFFPHDGAAKKDHDILQSLQSDPYWQSHFFRPTVVDPVNHQSKVVPLTLPADHLSQICLAIDFATRQHAMLEKNTTSCEERLISRLNAQHTLLLDNDATILAMPILPLEHPIRDEAFFQAHSFPAIVRWSPENATEFNQLSATRAQVKRFEGELLELKSRFEQENTKLSGLKAEKEIKKSTDSQKKNHDKETHLQEPVKTVSSFTFLSSAKSKSKLNPAARKASKTRLGIGVKNILTTLPLKPYSTLTQQLLASPQPPAPSPQSSAEQQLYGAETSSYDSPSNYMSPQLSPPMGFSSQMTSPASDTHSQKHVHISAAPTPVILRSPQTNAISVSEVVAGLDEFDIDATAASHLNLKTLHEWSTKGAAAASSTNPTSHDVEEKSVAGDTEIWDRASSRNSNFSTVSRAASRRVGAPTPSASMSAADRLYGPASSRSSSSVSETHPAKRPPRHGGAVPLSSPRTRRILAQAINADGTGDSDVESDSTGGASKQHSPALATSTIKVKAESKEQVSSASARGAGPSKRRTAADVSGSQTSRAAHQSTASLTGQQPPTTSPTNSLASSFVRLSRALSNATVGPGTHSAITSTTASATSIAAGDMSTGESAEARLARQTRLAKRKQLYGSIAAEMKAEREAELNEAARHASRKVVCTRGFSQAFTSQLTPVLNFNQVHPVQTEEVGFTDVGIPILGESFQGPYSGVTSTSYDASHLNHRSQQALQNPQSRVQARVFGAAHWQDDLQSMLSTSSSFIQAAMERDMPPAEAEKQFKDQRMIYAKLNYMRLDHIEAANNDNEAQQQ